YPAEVDVSIRPGWFYHAKEDDKVKSVAELLEIYEQSVGRNGLLLLNVPPDRKGQLAAVDVARLREFSAALARIYGTNLARGGTASGESAAGHSAEHLLDGDPQSWWL